VDREHRAGRVAAARQVAMAAAGVTAVSFALAAAGAGVLLGQARLARRVIPQAETPPPRGDGVYGPRFPGKPISMVVLGDSSAAGFGVHRPRETPGALLATGVSRRLRRPVRLRRLAVVGSTSAGLPHQVEAALEHRPDIALIVVGGNDVTHNSARDAAVRHLGDAVRRLRAAGAEVVVGTCPDLGAIRPIKPPLRWLARHWSRQLAAAQTVATVEAGGWTVSLGELLSARFVAEPARMFSADQFHPSAEGYARAAAGMLPTVLSAIAAAEGRAPATGAATPATPSSGVEGVRALPQAAKEAVRTAGTEISGARVDGRDRGPAGRWAMLRRHPWFEQRVRAGQPAAAGAVMGAVMGEDTGGGAPADPVAEPAVPATAASESHTVRDDETAGA
jgi:lysophospholipase L1-like esterase